MRRGNALPGELTPAKISDLIKEAEATKKKIQVTDCTNLILSIQPGRTKTTVAWAFRWAVKVGVGSNSYKNEYMSIGPYHTINIDEARERARQYRQWVLAGKDPRVERKKAISVEQSERDNFKTFNQVVDDYFNRKIKSKSIGERRRFDGLLALVRTNIGDKWIQSITRDAILSDDGCGLERIWVEKNPSGKILLSHLRHIFNYAKKMNWFIGENPTNDLEEDVLPDVKHEVMHHPSMLHPDVPNFIPQLRAWRYRGNWQLAGKAGVPISAYVVEMLVLTGVRTNEARKARFGEFDRETKIWTVPGFDKDGTQRTKNGKPHRLPITTGMLAILDEMEKIRTDRSPDAFVFPGMRRRRLGSDRPIGPVGANTLSRVLRDHLKLENKFTNHGFRSSLEGWCTANAYPESWWEIQVGHERSVRDEAGYVLRSGDKVTKAYKREDQLESRRKMMQAWDNFCNTPTPKPELKADAKPTTPKSNVDFSLMHKRRTA